LLSRFAAAAQPLQGMKWYLAENNILCKQYEDHVKAVSQRVKKAPWSRSTAELPVHMSTAATTKSKSPALSLPESTTEGDVCALSTMEMRLRLSMRDQHGDPCAPCLTITTTASTRNSAGCMRGFDLVPFCIHVCINGRNVSRRMDREGCAIAARTTVPWVEDVPRAQQLFQEQLAVNWTERLQPFAQRLNPLHEEIFRNYPAQYYWTGFQCEWATDVMFRPGTLTRLAPLLLDTGC